MSQTSRTEKTYDYVICGGGTAGCVIAARLAEDPTLSILLVEAGGSRDSVPASAIPAAVAQILGTEADWNIKSEPCSNLKDRQLHLARGKFLGGTSGCNGTLCIRGSREDYDAWSLEGWSGEEMYEYMSKAEKFQNKPWFEANEKVHGRSGPLLTAPHDPAPISSLVLKSFQSKGLPYIPDMFTSGESPHGCGHAVRTIYQGVRTTAADYISTDKARGDLDIMTNVYVDKVMLEDTSNGMRALGVDLQDSVGKKQCVKARREVIVTAGVYGSPTILLRSGIGERHEVESYGIKTRVDLPGVGKNLMDHLVTLIFYEVSEPQITNDHLIWHGGAKEKSIAQWKNDHTGFFSQIPFGTFAYARLDERLADSPLWQEAARSNGRDPMDLLPSQPHVEFWNTECYSPKYLYRDFPSDDKHAFAIAAEFFAPRSRGQVTLKSRDPTQNPVVDHNYLSDPLDLLVFSEACCLANEIVMEGLGTKDIVSGSWPAHLTHHTYTTREEWEPIIKAGADTCYHPAGSCKMGKSDDPMAVLDEELFLRGVSNLRVADASVMPKLMGGHPQMAVYGIAEKAADMIKEDAKNGGH